MSRAAPFGSDRERAYRVLGDLKREGRIASYIARQHPISKRWGFSVSTGEGDPFFFLPREAHAFAEGVRIGYGQGRDDEAAGEPTEGAA